MGAYRLTTAFLVLGATLYYGPLVFAVEGADQDYLAGFAQAFTSSTNVDFALNIMWVSLLGFVLVGGWLFIRAMNSASRNMDTGRPISHDQPQDAQTLTPAS